MKPAMKPCRCVSLCPLVLSRSSCWARSQNLNRPICMCVVCVVNLRAERTAARRVDECLVCCVCVCSRFVTECVSSWCLRLFGGFGQVLCWVRDVRAQAKGIKCAHCAEGLVFQVCTQNVYMFVYMYCSHSIHGAPGCL